MSINDDYITMVVIDSWEIIVEHNDKGISHYKNEIYDYEPNEIMKNIGQKRLERSINVLTERGYLE